MAPAPGINRGVSGLFVPPTPNLDPNLFGDSDVLLPGVRSWINDTGYTFLNQHYSAAHYWATIWIAGSGVSYQWSADRSPRDLDILVGVSMLSFKRHNPNYRGVDETTIAHLITQTFRTLGERTVRQQIGNATYEVTWYVNPGAADIRDIHPYAAYDVTHNRWTVRPPELPGDWGTHSFSPEWWMQIGREKKRAQAIIGEFLVHRSMYMGARDDATRTNAAQGMQYAAAQASVMFDDLHSNRRIAFSPQGTGYSDWNNFRWQAHKRNGVSPALHAIKVLFEEAKKESEVARYGHALATTEQALSTASLLNAHLNELEMR
jgi:hypothetical protein